MGKNETPVLEEEKLSLAQAELTVDFSKHQFRCHALGKIMTGVKAAGLTPKQEEYFQDLQARDRGHGKPLTDKMKADYGDLLQKKFSKPTLSKTAISYIEQLHKEALFGRDKEIYSKYLDKGLQVEEEGISIYTEVTDSLFVKNKKRFKNAWFTGEPDNIQGKVRDIKSSWDFDTFPMHATEPPNDDNIWQVQAYMHLTKLKSAEIIYVLVDTPDILINDFKRKTAWNLGKIDLPEELDQEIEFNMRYKDIPQELRVKVFHVEYDEQKIEMVKTQIKLAREHMNKLSLQFAEAIRSDGVISATVDGE